MLSFDSNQLTTIAVTAVVSVIAKEVVTWLWALAKTTASTATLRAKLSAIFTRINIYIFADLITIGIYVGWIFYKGWTDAPLTGKDALLMIGFLIGAASMTGMLMMHIGEATVARAKIKRARAALDERFTRDAEEEVA